MLTRHDLPLIRAALKFFEEEMQPFDAKLLRHYFERHGDAHFPPDAVEQLRHKLKRCEVRYVACDPSGTMVLNHRLRRSAKPALAAARSRRHRLATVLFFPNP